MTCPAHGFLLPCVSCAQRELHADRRFADLWLLGRVGGMAATEKPIRIRTKRRSLVLASDRQASA